MPLFSIHFLSKFHESWRLSQQLSKRGPEWWGRWGCSDQAHLERIDQPGHPTDCWLPSFNGPRPIEKWPEINFFYCCSAAELLPKLPQKKVSHPRRASTWQKENTPLQVDKRAWHLGCVAGTAAALAHRTPGDRSCGHFQPLEVLGAVLGRYQLMVLYGIVVSYADDGNNYKIWWSHSRQNVSSPRSPINASRYEFKM